MEREGDDLRGDFGREARERLRGQRHERLPMGLLVRREAAGRGDLAQVGVFGVGRDRSARIAGGYNSIITEDGYVRDKLQIYDIQARTWRMGARIPERLIIHDIRGLAVDGKFLVFQYGDTSWRMFVYDPLMDSWTVESELPWRQYFIMPPPCIHNGRLVVFTRDGAFERATDGSWSSSEYECDDLQGLSGIRFVCKSVLLG